MAGWLDKLIVALVLMAAIVYVWRTYRRKALVGGACKSGCGNACGSEPKQNLVQLRRPLKR